MKNHLLSIFPVHKGDIYARLSCLSLAESDVECAAPFICDTPEALRACLKHCYSHQETEDIIVLLEAGEIVHRQLTDADARALGFQPVIQ